MKGISLAIETIVYLILAVTVLSVLLFFFLSQAGPAQDQFTLESERNRWCATYTANDFSCKGPVSDVSEEVLVGIGTACSELSRRFGFAYECSTRANIQCIQKCCLTCPQ